MTRLIKLAHSGAVDAQFQLGRMYETGEGMTQDLKESRQWYEKAAQQGSDAAQYNLGRMLFYGLGTVQDRKRAFGWIYQSAKQGNSGEHQSPCQPPSIGIEFSPGPILPRHASMAHLVKEETSENSEKSCH